KLRGPASAEPTALRLSHRPAWCAWLGYGSPTERLVFATRGVACEGDDTTGAFLPGRKAGVFRCTPMRGIGKEEGHGRGLSRRWQQGPANGGEPAGRRPPPHRA